MSNLADSTGSGQKPWREEVIPFTADDGFACNLIHIQGPTARRKARCCWYTARAFRANLFRAPVETNFVDYLMERGYDVWL